MSESKGPIIHTDPSRIDLSINKSFENSTAVLERSGVYNLSAASSGQSSDENAISIGGTKPEDESDLTSAQNVEIPKVPLTPEERYLEIEVLTKQFDEAMKEAIKTGDDKRITELQHMIEMKMEELREELDPYQLELRQKIAKEHGYSYVGVFSDGLAATQKPKGPRDTTIAGHDEWGYIDRTGEFVIPKKFSSAGGFNNGVAVVQIFDEAAGNRFFEYLINTKGEEISKRYEDISGFSDGVALAAISAIHDPGNPTRKGQFAYINEKGEEIFSGEFEDPKPFSEGMALAKKDGRWVYLDRDGNEAIKGEFITAESFSEGLATVNDKDGWYFIDHTGIQVLPKTKKVFGLKVLGASRYKTVKSFSEGLAGVGDDYYRINKFVDKNGEPVITNVNGQNFKHAGRFKDGMAIINGLIDPKFIIDKSGNVLLEVSQAEYANEGLIWVVRKGETKWSLIDKKGNTVVPEGELELGNANLPAFHSGVASVRKRNPGNEVDELVMIDTKGNRVFVNDDEEAK